jgi:replicative DNA helicase
MFKSNGSTFEGLSTGLTHLDEKLQGLKKAEMIVIAARPSVGKTSLAMNIAESCALGLDMNNVPVKADGGKRHPVMIFSLEMPVEALTRRMIAGRANINTWRLNRNLCSKSEKMALMQNLFQAAGDLKDAPIYVDDAAGLDVMDLRARARRADRGKNACRAAADHDGVTAYFSLNIDLVLHFFSLTFSFRNAILILSFIININENRLYVNIINIRKFIKN